MLNEDCLNVRLGEYLQGRRAPSPDTTAEEAGGDAETCPGSAGSNEG
jgi:hypothetical protein